MKREDVIDERLLSVERLDGAAGWKPIVVLCRVNRLRMQFGNRAKPRSGRDSGVP